MLLAEAIAERVPSVEKVRMVSSGTEATMSAIRVARGFTGRDRLVKFAGNYHGHSDALLVQGGTAMASLGLPASAGVPAGAVADTVVAPYNVVPELDEGVACVIVEPVAANMGLVAPVPGFLEGLRAECDRVGALLIFDEVITGFRLARGGAQERFGVQPDLSAFGKVIGGGLPVGAFGGRGEVMDVLAPLGPVYQAGTLSGNPLATAAGLATLELLDDDAYVTLADRAARLGAGLTAAFAARRSHGAGAGVRDAAGALLRRGRGHRLPLGPAHRRGPLRPLLPRDAGPRRRPRPGCLRGAVPGPGPRRRDRGRDHRGGPPRGRGHRPPRPRGAPPVTAPMPAVIASMLARRSVATFAEPGPTAPQLELILAAATTVPDHGNLRPWRFVVVDGDGRGRFGEALAAAALEADPDLTPERADKARRKATLAPCLVVLIASPVEPAKVPVWEQVVSASCTGYAMVLAADALGLGAVWKTAAVVQGDALRAALDLAPGEQVLGWVNIGRRPDRTVAPRRELDLAERVMVLRADGLAPWSPPTPS